MVVAKEGNGNDYPDDGDDSGTAGNVWIMVTVIVVVKVLMTVIVLVFRVVLVMTVMVVMVIVVLRVVVVVMVVVVVGSRRRRGGLHDVISSGVTVRYF